MNEWTNERRKIRIVRSNTILRNTFFCCFSVKLVVNSCAFRLINRRNLASCFCHECISTHLISCHQHVTHFYDCFFFLFKSVFTSFNTLGRFEFYRSLSSLIWYLMNAITLNSSIVIRWMPHKKWITKPKALLHSLNVKVLNTLSFGQAIHYGGWKPTLNFFFFVLHSGEWSIFID